MNKRKLLISILQIIFLWVLANLIMAMIYPQLFVHHAISFIRFLDPEFVYIGSFSFLSNLYTSGGLQLWNPYDQMPLMFYYMQGGVLTTNQITGALLYPLISSGFESKGEAFHAIASMAPFLTTSLIQIIGLFVLVRRYSSRAIVVFPSVLIAATLLSPELYFGLTCANVFCLFPLMLFFLLRFFESFRINDALVVLVLMIVCAGTNPFILSGYFYQGIHFFIIAALVWSVFRKGSRISKLFKRETYRFSRGAWVRIGLTLLLFIVVMAPWVVLVKGSYHDYDFAHAGSRMEHFFSVSAYFDRPVSFAPQKDYLLRSLDYATNDWGNSWKFIGFTSLFVALCGLILGKDDTRFVFFGAGLLIWLINSPRISTDAGYLVHWLNALTNPTKALVRSYHMQGAFLMHYLLVPFLAMGFDALLKRVPCESKGEQGHGLHGLLTVGIIVSVIAAMVAREVEARVALSLLLSVSIASLLLILLGRMTSLPHRMRLGGAALLLLGLFSIDLFHMREWMRSYSNEILLTEYEVPGLEAFGKTMLDFQNPEIMPYREYYNCGTAGQIPHWITVNSNNMQGLFYRHTNLGKYKIPATDKRTMHHIAYCPLHEDELLKSYLDRDRRTTFQACLAVREAPGVFEKIMESGLDRTVIMIDEMPGDAGPWAEKLPETLPEPMHPPERSFTSIALDAGAARIRRRGALDLYELRLPEGFPRHMTTCIYTEDSGLLKVKFEGRELIPAQGALVSPYTFDVQNMETGTLVVALPGGTDIEAEAEFTFTYPLPNRLGITRIVRYEADTLEFDYTAEEPGWLVLQQPFDRRWKASIDGKPVGIYRADRAFTAVPVDKGTQRCVLEYRPGSWLRPGLALAYILALVALVWALCFSVAIIHRSPCTSASEEL